MILPILISPAFHHPADVRAAIPAFASEDEIIPVHFCHLQKDRDGRKALSTPDVVENPLPCLLRDFLPSPRPLRRERIGWVGRCSHLSLL
jgi:hypothetical protein